MKKSVIHICVIAFLLGFSLNLLAVKATPFPFFVRQPNGQALKVRLHGDEFFRYMTTDDGVLVAQSADNYYKYATMSAEGGIEATNVNAVNLENRSYNDSQFVSTLQKINEIGRIAQTKTMRKVAASNEVIRRAYPLSGSPKTLIILVNFSDNAFTVANPKDAFTNLLNQEGYSANGGTGSAKDYFKDASSGVFSPQFDVVGPYTLPNNMAYYGANVSGDDKNPQQMVIDACSLANKNGVDFTQYDTDNDGMVDNVFVYYAGYNEAEGGAANTIWPHRWTLANYQTKFNGKIIFDYACTSELRGSSGTNMCGVGTFCHEFGHVLGLPDYYNTVDDSQFTVSYWDIMDEGPYLNYGRTPPTYSAYDRFYLGWLTPIELKTAQNVSLTPINQGNKAYLISKTGNHNLNGQSPSPNEFIMLENRQKIGWDTYLPGHGLLVTRINYNATNWENNVVNNTPTALGYNVIEADGTASSSSYSGDPFPGAANVTSYQPALNDGTLLNKPLTMIAENSGIITFKFMGGGLVPVVAATSNFSQFSTVQGTPSASQTMAITGSHLKDTVFVSFKTKTNFEMKKFSESNDKWRKTISLLPVDSVVDTTKIMIRYNPVEPSYKFTHSETLVVASKSADTVQVNLAGNSTRPIYVVAPVATEATDVTYASFNANWQPVFDASGYYLTVFSVSEGSSRMREGFDAGLTAPKDWVINVASINTSTIYSGVANPSILFKKNGEYVQTQKYIPSPDGLSFYVHSVGESKGSLVVEGFNGSQWSRIDSVLVVSTLNDTLNYSWSQKGYERFRFRFYPGTGQLTLDDVSALFHSNVEFVCKDSWVTDVFSSVPNLVSDRDHYYYVKASDKTLYSDNTIKYENITNVSNIMYVRTLKDTETKRLRAVPQADGSVVVIVPDTDNVIYVYNVLGQLYETIQPDNNVVTVKNLPRNQIYLLKSGDRIAKIIL